MTEENTEVLDLGQVPLEEGGRMELLFPRSSRALPITAGSSESCGGKCRGQSRLFSSVFKAVLICLPPTPTPASVLSVSFSCSLRQLGWRPPLGTPHPVPVSTPITGHARPVARTPSAPHAVGCTGDTGWKEGPWLHGNGVEGFSGWWISCRLLP